MSKPANGSNSTQSADTVLSRWEPVIGLEIHCQLKTKSKLFCSCATDFGALPNNNTCPICLGYPGVLPVLNERAVEFALRMALAIGADIHETSVFSRKQYFYPDLPKGYQISQYDLPYCTGGKIVLADGKTIGVTRIHIEEDAGKNVHGNDSSYVDLNRAGIPLIEMVSNPDIRHPSEAAEYLKKVRSLVRHLEICDGNLEEGSFRCDANVSIRPRGESKFGTRTEIKNLNSFKNIERAITYEILRQAELLEGGGKVIQQTLLFDAATGKTAPLRSKEESHDYRYFPEPDLRPLKINAARIAKVKEHLPELPDEMAKRYQSEYGLNEYDASVLTSEKELALFFEAVVREVKNVVSHKIVANWMLSEYLREANAREWDLTKPPVSASDFAELLRLIGENTISGKIAKTVFEEMVANGGKPSAIVKDKGLVQITDEGAIRETVGKILAENASQVEQYLSGKDRLFGFFVGQAMKISQGKYNPELLNKVIKEMLDEKKG